MGDLVMKSPTLILSKILAAKRRRLVTIFFYSYHRAIYNFFVVNLRMENTQLNIPEIIVKLESNYQLTINLISEIGIKVDERLKHNRENDKLIIGRDTLKRVQTNIQVLGTIKISHTTVVSYRLILRSIFADLVEAIYLLASSDTNLKAELWKRNLEAVRTFELWTKEKVEYYSKVDPQPQPCIDLNRMYPFFSEFVKPDSPTEFCSRKINKKLDTASMAEKLKKHPFEPLNYINQLYLNYRFLSLTEHYTPVFRRHSYLLPVDYSMFLDFSGWIFIGIKLLSDMLTELLDTGTIKFVLDDGTIIDSI